MPGVPNKTRLESSVKKFNPHFIYMFQGTTLPRKTSNKTSNKKDNDPGSPKRVKDKREWRQALFKNVTAKSPRQVTPGRRSSQSILFSLQGTDGKSKSENTLSAKASRRAFVRKRWRKAMEQQLMLIRMANKNTDLAVSKELAEKEAKSQHKKRLEQLWAPLWQNAPKEWNDGKLRMCVRAGVPAHLRGRYLMAIAERFSASSKPSQKYVDLLMQPCIYRHAIRIDIGRTFPDVPYFSKAMGRGQSLLYNCMAAYSNLDEEVGYCQGLCFPGGLFLLQLNEEDAFTSLTSALYEHGLREQYMPDMHMLQVQLYQFSRLLHDVCRPVYARLAELEIEPYFYVSQWFLCWFSSNFPKEFAVRMLDFIMLDGKSVMFKMACALLILNKDKILSSADFESTVRVLQHGISSDSPPAQDVPKLLDMVDVSTAQLDQYASEFQLMKKELPAMYINPEDAVKECSKLVEKLMDCENDKARLQMDLDTSQEQLNHAKSALQSMAAELQGLQKELSFVRGGIALDSVSDSEV